jgi:hypothetical protein
VHVELAGYQVLRAHVVCLAYLVRAHVELVEYRVYLVRVEVRVV